MAEENNPLADVNETELVAPEAAEDSAEADDGPTVNESEPDADDTEDREPDPVTTDDVDKDVANPDDTDGAVVICEGDPTADSGA